MTDSELMLRMAWNGATEDDVGIQKALGDINVSAKLFEAAYKISELPDDCIQYIVEAASNANLPTDKGEAVEVANEAVVRELSAFYSLMTATTKKVRSSAERNLMAFQKLGKKYGVSYDKRNFVSGFLNPLCEAIQKDGGLEELDERTFIKSKYAARMVENYGKGMANLMSGFGLSIDKVFDQSVVGMIVKPDQLSKRDVTNIKNVESALSAGGKYLSFDKMLNKQTHYQNYVKMVDIKTLGISVFALAVISDAILVTLNNAGNKKLAIENLKKTIKASTGSKHVTRTLESIADGQKEWSENLKNLTTNIDKGLTDSTYALLKLTKRKSK